MSGPGSRSNPATGRSTPGEPATGGDPPHIDSREVGGIDASGHNKGDKCSGQQDQREGAQRHAEAEHEPASDLKPGQSHDERGPEEDARLP